MEKFSFKTSLFNRLLLLVFLLPAFLVNGQPKMSSLSHGEEMTFYSDVLQQRREILIFSPDYGGTIGKKIPVFYVLDGENHFEYLSGMVSYLARQQLIPPMLVVAIKNINRNIDFTPVQLGANPNSGGAEKFHRFIENELDPIIQKKYYTSGYRVLMGHSLGGVFANYSMLYHPDFFDSYISVSPYLQLDDEYSVNKASELLKPDFEKPKFLYLTIGNEPDYFPTLQRYVDVLKKTNPSNFEYDYVQMPQYDHGSSPVISAYNGLIRIFKDWPFQNASPDEGVASMDAHNEFLSKKYGMDVETGEQQINLLGYTYLREGKNEMAIKTLMENTKRFPKSPNVYDSLGDAYKAAGDFEKAKMNYEKAVKLGLKYGSVFIETYKNNLKDMEEKINTKGK